MNKQRDEVRRSRDKYYKCLSKLYIHHWFITVGRRAWIDRARVSNAEVGSSISSHVKLMTYKIDTCRYLA